MHSIIICYIVNQIIIQILKRIMCVFYYISGENSLTVQLMWLHHINDMDGRKNCLHDFHFTFKAKEIAPQGVSYASPSEEDLEL